MAKVKKNNRKDYESDDGINNNVRTEECLGCGELTAVTILSPLGLCPTCVISNAENFFYDKNDTF